MHPVRLFLAAALGAGVSLLPLTSLARERTLDSKRSSGPGISDRTLVLAVEIDRDQARLLSFTRKDRPFLGPLEPAEARAWGGAGEPVQVEVRLVGPDGASFTRRIEVGPLCLEHPAGDAPHIEGDTILVHRDSFLVELPELKGLDQVEIAYYTGDVSHAARRGIGFETLDPARFTAAGEVGFAGGGSSIETSGAVIWPEDVGDLERYTVYGNEAQILSRINIVIVPDGYRYAEKALMQTHAQTMVNAFRAKTPYKEHDPFINYILVYAYSTESGTDECDCGTVKDTAMNTRFPDAGFACGNSGNRCLYYGTGNGGPNCDPNTSSANISAAELRAPAQDKTLIMVNTARYGGCGGARAVYAGGNSSAGEIGIHELGHSLAGLADEYGGDSGCGSGSGINVSTDATNGAWPEWIADLGNPRQGGKYYDQCIYRPVNNCDMRALNQPFCAVCNQRWSLVYFGHARVNPTAPLTSQTPASPASAVVGTPAPFAVVTRLATGAVVTNEFTWRLQGPGYATPTVVGTGSPNYIHNFALPGTYTLTCEVIADTNFVKPAKYGANVDTATWTVNVTAGTCDAAPSFSGLTSAIDLAGCAATGVELTWGPASFGPDGGSYDIWKDGVRIVRGVTASPYVHLPGDSLSHVYRVRAASADCDLTDNNTADLSARDAIGDAAPAFAGLASAADVATCAASGVQLSWPAATFGASGGSYDVWRDAGRIAIGLTSLSYLDLPGDSAVHAYRVVAVSADCTRPDGNAVTHNASDQSGDPAPTFAGLTTAADRETCAASGVDLAWNPASFGPASGYYNVLRDGVFVASFLGGTAHLDLPGDGAIHVYQVVAMSGDCGLADGNTVTRNAADAAGDPPPTFAGIRSASDLDACLATGIALAWDPAAFGPGAGYYTIYRDGGLLATFVSATTLVDQPGDGLTHAYRVVAVSGDCGREDGNGVILGAADSFLDPTAPLPDPANTLTARKSAGTVELVWPVTPGAATYNVYRSDVAGTWPPVAEASGLTATSFSIADLTSGPTLLFYRVSGTTCSGVEGP